MAKKKPKKRNILKESKKATEPETPEAAKAPDTATDEKLTPSPTISKSRKKTSIEAKREKDRIHQQDKRDRDKDAKGEKQEQEGKELLLAIEVFCCMPFDVLAKTNEKWLLSDKEREAFTGSAKAILDKYTDSILSGYAVETSFLLCTATILIPRLVTFNGKENKQIDSHPGEAGNGKDIPGEGDDRIQAQSPGL